jgi:hypothetical protein
MYVALHKLHKQMPEFWTAERLIWLTNVGSWKVIGITPRALTQLAASDFKRPKGHGLQRAHFQRRYDTMRELLDPATPLPEAQFIAFWDANDRTVLCAKGENNFIGPGYTDYIPIENEDGLLFSATVASLRHNKKEREFLRELHERQAAA